MRLLKKQTFCKNYKNEAKNFVFNTLRRVFLIDINICIESDGACRDKCRPSFFLLYRKSIVRFLCDKLNVYELFL